MMKNEKNLKGVVWLSYILIVLSAWQLATQIPYDRYVYVFQYLPADIINIRYAGSVILRVLVIFFGLGLLEYNNKARVGLICLLAYNSITVYWKHPYLMLMNTARYFHHRPEEASEFLVRFVGSPPVDTEMLFRSIALVNCVGDLIFNGIIIYYLTRPHVEGRFR